MSDAEEATAHVRSVLGNLDIDGLNVKVDGEGEVIHIEVRVKSRDMQTARRRLERRYDRHVLSIERWSDEEPM